MARAFVFAFLLCAAADIDYVDLSSKKAKELEHTKFVRKSSCPSTVGSGGMGMQVGDPRPTGGLFLELVEIDSPVVWDQRVLATVRLWNGSDKSVRVPYALDPQVFETPDENGRFTFESAGFGFKVGTSKVESVALPVRIKMFASEQIPSTYQELRPNEGIRFRIAVPLDCDRQQSTCRDIRKAGELQVAAYFSDERTTITYGDCSISSSSVAGRWVATEEKSVTVQR